MARKKLIAIDLFCGAGGLTLGLKNAGFDVRLGIEKRPEIAETYAANFGRDRVLIEDIQNVTGQKILKKIKADQVDLVAGCPPCQGFSSLTWKWDKIDPRNVLVLEMSRIVRELKPRMVMMENVPGLSAETNRIWKRFLKELEDLDYKLTYGVLQMADYGVPQSRRRLVVLAGKGFEISLPKPTHNNKKFKVNKSSPLKAWVPISKALKGFGKPITFKQWLENGHPFKTNWHIVADLKPISKDRLRFIKAGEDRRVLPKHLRPDCHKDEEKGFTNVYGRMRWNAISPTMTSGITRPCMGRFGHPDRLRTISVREAATLQTFPKNFVLKTEKMDVVLDLVGNALPPKFATIAGKKCLKALENKKGVGNG